MNTAYFYRLIAIAKPHNPPYIIRPADYDPAHPLVFELQGYDWNHIVNRPKEFKPAFHTQPVRSINGLEEALALAEPRLGTPANNNYVLSSTTAGVRSWRMFSYSEVGAAASEHTHAGLYEGQLGNPAASGYVLSSTTDGQRSWTALPTNFEAPLGNPGVSDYVLSSTTAGARSWRTFTYSDVGAASSDHTHADLYEPVLGNPNTSGYVLASTTTGTRSWVSLPSVGLTGGGTSGTIPIWTGSGTQGDSLVSWSKPGAYDIVAVNAILDLQGHNLVGVGNVLCTAIENTYGSLALVYGNGQHVRIFCPSGIDTVIDASGVQSAFKSSDGTAGLTTTKTIHARNSDDSAAVTHTVTIKDGLITAWTTSS